MNLKKQEKFSSDYKDKLVGHASIDSTAIIGRKKACHKNTPKIKLKKKRGRKSEAEKAAMAKQELAEIKARRLERQPNRTLVENISDLTQGCDWAKNATAKGKRVSGADTNCICSEGRENPALTGEEGNVPKFDFSRLLVKKGGIGTSKRL